MVLLMLCWQALRAQEEPIVGEPEAVADTVKVEIDSLTLDSAQAEPAVLLIPEEDDTFGPYAFRKRTLDGAYHRLDSFVNIQQLDNFVLPHKSAFGLLPLANIGSGLQNLSFVADTQHLSHFTMGVSEWGFRQVSELPLYDVKSPVSDMQFITAYGRGQHFRLNFAQNLGPRWNYFASYDRINSLGDYPNSRTVVDDFIFTTHYTSPNRRLRIEGMYQFNKRILNEFGGLRNLTEFTENTTPVRNQILPLLSNTGSEFVRNDLFSRQRYVLFRNQKDFLVSLENTMHTTIRRFEFNTGDTALFSPPIAGLPTNDSLRTVQYDQQAGLTFGKQQASGERQEIRVYGFYHFHQLGSAQLNMYRESFGIGSEVAFQDKRDYIQVSGTFNLNLIGNQSGSVLRSNIRVGQVKNWHLTGGLLLSGRQADPFWETYRSNHYNWLHEDWNPIRTQRVSIGLKKSELLGINYNVYNLQNWLYLDTNATPAQASEAVQLQQLEVFVKMKSGKWEWRNQGLIQRATSADDYLVIRVPEVVYRSTLVFNYSVIKGVLKGQLGIDGHYFSSFFAQAYNPALNRFNLQDQTAIGNFPYIHLFATAQLKSFQFFVRIENVTEGISRYNYFAAPGIPLPDRFVRLGFNWRFFE
jgi:hypothetical protein